MENQRFSCTGEAKLHLVLNPFDAIKDENPEVRVLYEPASKTCFIINADYYGWVKSFALGVAADFLEEYVSIHSRFSVHGSCIDFSGRGIALIATSGAGKTTHSFGLLLLDNAKLITDDWFFVKLTIEEAIQYLTENNFCNPYQMVKDERKIALRIDFFREMFRNTEVYLFNNNKSLPIEETHGALKKLVKDL